MWPKGRWICYAVVESVVQARVCVVELSFGRSRGSRCEMVLLVSRFGGLDFFGGLLAVIGWIASSM